MLAKEAMLIMNAFIDCVGDLITEEMIETFAEALEKIGVNGDIIVASQED